MTIYPITITLFFALIPHWSYGIILWCSTRLQCALDDDIDDSIIYTMTRNLYSSQFFDPSISRGRLTRFNDSVGESVNLWLFENLDNLTMIFFHSLHKNVTEITEMRSVGTVNFLIFFLKEEGPLWSPPSYQSKTLWLGKQNMPSNTREPHEWRRWRVKVLRRCSILVLYQHVYFY